MKKRINIRTNKDGTRTKTTTYTWKTITGATKSESRSEKLPPKKGGCYVATAVYGSYDCPEVWTLRRYRDEHLEKSIPGRLFIRLYYATSPHFVRVFGNTKLLNVFIKHRLDRFVTKLRSSGYSDTFYQDK